MLFPMIIGWALIVINKDVQNPLHYNYTIPMLLLDSLGAFVSLLGLWLKPYYKILCYSLALPILQHVRNK